MIALITVCVLTKTPAALAAAPISPSATPKATADQVTFFEQRIRPVLAEHCYKCHSQKSKKLKAGLLLDSRHAIIKGGDTGPSIISGQPDKSLLITAIGYLSTDLEMPPKKKLSDRAIEDFKQWVKMGAPWPEDKSKTPGATDSAPNPLLTKTNWQNLRNDNWAYRKLTPGSLPKVKLTNWPANPIDNYILATLESKSLTPSPQAQKRKLIRRAYFDLVGLPPSPEQVAAFLADKSNDAFAKVVDQLLTSPHYGERWARHWLDVARYSDGYGGFLDNKGLPNAWVYRDWVVSALNKDLPYDDFVRQQIAGDVINQNASHIATGFFAVGPTYNTDGGDAEATSQAKAETLADRVDTVSRAFLGLTVQCARCHDHKFDPITQNDYYAIAGIFNNTRLADAPHAPQPVIDKYNNHQKLIKDAEKKRNDFINAYKKANKNKHPDKKNADLVALQKTVNDLKKSSPPKFPTVHVLAEAGSRDMNLAIRGDLRKKGPIVPRRFLNLFVGDDGPRYTKGSGRLELAESIISKDTPLAARVMVNRIWQKHFGQALVRTPSNFGALGEKPSHPQLLDHLAKSFIDSGWSIKKLHRTIMLSKTYQMSSDFNQKAFDIDGDNRLLWRMNPRRLDVEAWRDGILKVTGELDQKLGGAPVTNLLASNRRTIYSVVSRNGDRFESDAFLRLFDFPAPRSSIAKRTTSTVPQQYLFMMNSPFMQKRAQVLADQLIKEATDDKTRINQAYEKLYSRPPTESETKVGVAFLENATDKPNAWRRYAQVLLSAHEFMQVQ
jgi:hypothetical protein